MRSRVMQVATRLWLCAVMSLLASAPVLAMQAAPEPTPQGDVQIDKVPRDPDFGVSTRHSGLQRHVEMYQWTRAGDSYALAWRGARVDSSGFAPGHDNPKAMPLREREWHAAVRLDGKPVPDAVLADLGDWTSFRPNFSALPGNMSATFQPEGDGLGSADNPLTPQVGDLRVTWRAFVLPSLADKLVLRNGAWALRATTTGPAAADVAPPPAGQQPRTSRWLLSSGAGVVLLIVVVAAMRRRRRKPAG